MAGTNPAPHQPATEDEARMRVLQIIGTDLGAPDAFNGDWRQALKDTSARWSAWERISKIPETLHGSFVYAQANRQTGERRVVCSGCKALDGRSFNSDAVAIITAAEHAESVDH
ncbi:hypothetical protein [Streptomyces chartreusis]|uniref:hypothetical protein n=1 Tax=Streptomyces chartreusis TaxID=1969 RepID=UPI00381450AD